MEPLRHRLLFLFVFLLASCQEQTSQTGHQEIAPAVRRLLDKAYAGIDYPSYRDNLEQVEAVAAKHLAATPASLRSQVGQMLAYLRTAEEVLRWQIEKGPGDTIADERAVAAWIKRYPFLQVARGAHAEAPEAFDPETALTLLWDKTDELLRNLQVKSNPL
jgi:hypothetical protein